VEGDIFMYHVISLPYDDHTASSQRKALASVSKETGKTCHVFDDYLALIEHYAQKKNKSERPDLMLLDFGWWEIVDRDASIRRGADGSSDLAMRAREQGIPDFIKDIPIVIIGGLGTTEFCRKRGELNIVSRIGIREQSEPEILSRIFEVFDSASPDEGGFVTERTFKEAERRFASVAAARGKPREIAAPVPASG
jgi:hypothetical protein